MEKYTHCEICGKKLIAYKVWKDWECRTSHYACWKRKQDDIAYANMLQSYLEDEERKKNINAFSAEQAGEEEGK